MNSTRLDRISCTGLVALLLVVASASAEIPGRSREQLLEAASHAFVGSIERTYERREKDDDGFDHIYSVAEVKVERVDKGTDIKAQDRIFVRYWSMSWRGAGSAPPGHYGHWDVPNATDTADIFVSGDRKTGYDVLSPNGFFKVTKTRSTNATPKR